MYTDIKDKGYLLIFTVALSILVEIISIYFFLNQNGLFLLLIMLLLLLISLIAVKYLGLNNVTLLYLFVTPLIIYIAHNQIQAIQNLGARLVFLENSFLAFLLVINILFSEKKKEKYYKGILFEAIIIVMLFIGNFITYIQLSYDFKVFLLSSNFYLKYFLITLIIYYSDIDFKTLVKIMHFYSVIIIINAFICMLQFIFGDVFLSPFIGGYYYSIRNDLVRSIGMFPWPTEQGTYSGIFFIMYYFSGKYLERKYFYSISVLCILNILLSQSRLALLIVIMILLYDNIKKISGILKYLIVLIGIYIILNLGMGIDFNKYVQDTIKEYSVIESAPRIYYVIHGYDIFKDYPLFGIGFDRFGTKWISELDNYYFFAKYHIKRFEILSTTDSFAAKILPEFGLYGAILLIILFSLLSIKAIKIKKVNPEFSLFFYALIYYLMYQFNSAHSYFNWNMGPQFWLVSGFIIKYYYIYYGSKIEIKGLHVGL